MNSNFILEDYLHDLGNYGSFTDEILPFLTMFPRISFFRTFLSIKESGSYLILRTAKWHGCPVLVPQAYVRYERIKHFLLAKMLALAKNMVF